MGRAGGGRSGGGKVMSPGSRGGSFYTTAGGNIRYGKAPAGRAGGGGGASPARVSGGAGGGGAAASAPKAAKPRAPAPKVDHLPAVRRQKVAVQSAKADLSAARSQLKSKDKAVVAQARAKVVDAKTRVEKHAENLKSVRKVNQQHLKGTPAKTPLSSELAAKSMARKAAGTSKSSLDKLFKGKNDAQAGAALRDKYPKYTREDHKKAAARHEKKGNASAAHAHGQAAFQMTFGKKGRF
jgi:hypothetical protein